MRHFRWFALATALCLLLLTLSPAMSSNEEPLHEIGVIPTGTLIDSSATGGVIPKMLVDTDLNIGVTMADRRLFVYDLAAMRIESVIEEPTAGYFFGLTALNAAIDPRGHRVYFPPDNGADLVGASCPTGPSELYAIKVFEITSRSWTTMSIPCAHSDRLGGQGPGSSQFRVEALSYHEPTGLLYAVGTAQADFAARPPAAQYAYGQTLLMRQMNPQTGHLDWEVDLRPAGCDRTSSEFGSFVGRHRGSVISYCYSVRDGLAGSHGIALQIPLDDRDNPQIENGSPRIRATPTLPNDLAPLLDPGSGRLLLLTAGAIAGAANGNAVWVFDVFNERFFGVIATGVPNDDGQFATTYVGINNDTGRAYLLYSKGILVADARHSPLPAGVSYPILAGVDHQGQGNFIAVAPRLNRIFVPVRNRGYVVVKDDLPPPLPFDPEDLDAGTADIPEVQGKTGVVYSGAAAGFGAHVLITGGLPRAVDNNDPTCILDPTRVRIDDRCASEQLLTSGNREVFLGATQIEFGSETGISADASGVAIPPADTATDADLKRLGDCEAEPIAARTGQPLPPTYSEFCAGSPLAPFRYGTRGQGGGGYPVEGATCVAYGSGFTQDERRPQELGPPSTHWIGSSRVECNAKDKSGLAIAAASALSFPDSVAPVFSVARTATEITTSLTQGGVVTTVSSSAAGVRIGDFSIGEILTTVKTQAKGRTGTAQTEIHRSISGVHGPGISCAIECDGTAVAKAITDTLGQRVRASVPEALQVESPRGYQSFVVKDPALRDSERASNDDDTFTVNGLTIVFLNDGLKGRNRVVLQLAGVQAESRYGIFALPEESRDQVLGETFDFVPDALPPVQLPPTIIERVKTIIGKAVRYPIYVAVDAYNLVVHNPREFGLLFLMWSIFAAPIYFAIRRRAFARLLAR